MAEGDGKEALDRQRFKFRNVLAKKKAREQELLDALDEATKENDELKPKATAAEKLEKELAETKGKLRADTHMKAFKAAAKAAGIKDELLDDAWELAKLKADAEEPDEKIIGKAVNGLIEKRPWMKAEDKAKEDDDKGQGGKGKAKEGKEAALPKGEGAARGGRNPNTSKLSLADQVDADFEASGRSDPWKI